MADFTGLGLPPTPGSIAPSGTFGAPAGGGGVLDTITRIASNPLLQAAMAGYLGYAGSPRRGGRGLAMENAGMNAMGAFNRAEQEQIQTPLQQQQLLQSQLQTEALKRQLTPLSPELTAKLDVLKATATDAHERASLDYLESLAQGGLLSPSDLATVLPHYDEAKRLQEMARAQTQMSSPQMMQWFFQMQDAIAHGRPIPPMPTPTAIPGVGASMASAGAGAAPTEPPAAAPPSPATSMPDISAIGVGVVRKRDIPGLGKVNVTRDTDGTLLYLKDGAWTALP